VRNPVLRALLLVGSTEGARGLVMVLTNVHLARTLGERDFGIIGFAQSVYVYAALLGNFGLEWIGSRLASQHAHPEQAKVGTIFAVRLVTCSSALLLMLGFCAVSGQPHETKVAILAWALTISALPILVDWYFYGKQNVGVFVVGRVAGQAILLISVLVFVGPDSSLALYPLLFGISTFAQTLYFLVAFLRIGGSLRPRLAGSDVRTLLVSSGTFFLSLVCTQVLQNVSFIVLGFGGAERSLGHYTAAHRLAFGVFSALGTVLGQALFPVLSRQFSDSVAAAVRTMRVYWALGLAGSITVAVIGVELSGPIMEWVYSPAFRSGSSVLAVLMLCAALMLLESPLVYAMLATHHERIVLVRGAVTACLCVVLNALLAPAYGAMGAAIANTIAVGAGAAVSAVGYAALVRPRLRAARAAEASATAQ
jgi:O-antigen/teichoic acid export membrane protein